MANTDSNCKACDDKKNNSLPQRQIADFASTGNIGGALGASFGLAIDTGTAGKLGSRLANKPTNQLMSFIDTPGNNKQKKLMSESQKKSHLINSIGLGNFSLNSTFESGLINSISSARGDSSNFLKNNKTGASIAAASALGIDIPGANMLGIGPGDSSMFKIFKLAAFGLRLLCASLRGTRRGPGGYSSDTEEALGLILSIGINLDLFSRLKSIFDKLLNLKFNFSSFDLDNLNIANVLLNLCDWVENMEYGSDTIDTLRKNFDSGLSNKGLTEVVGKSLISNGTYDSYARNDFSFDQQFKSIAGDIDMLKCDACNLGKADVKIAQNNRDLVNIEFDPRTGLQREKINSEIKSASPIQNNPIIANTGINYVTDTEGITFTEDINLVNEPKIEIGESLLSNKKIKVADNLTEPALAGTDILKVKNSSQFPLDSWVEIGEGTSVAECAQCVAYGSLKLKNPLISSHDVGTTISNPTKNNPCLNKINQTKKETQILNTEFTQKSISTQIDDEIQISKLNNKFKKVDTSKDAESVKKQLGIVEDIESEKIETTLTETKIKPSAINKPNNISKNIKTQADLQSEIKKDTKTPHNFSTENNNSGIQYETETSNVVYDTYEDDQGNIKEDKYIKDENNNFKKEKSSLKYNKPVGGGPADADATEVQCFHSGETITREELEGTVLENADLNAVALLHPNDRENLKDTAEVNKVLADADKKHTEKLNKEIEKTENLVLEQQSGGIIFGVQLPTTLNGNQIVINSERVLISAKTQEVGIFAKRKFFVSTDDEITMNCKQRFVVKTDRHASLEAPSVHLGLYTTQNHPSLKGDCVMWWMNDLCDWLAGHTHSDPFITTGSPTQQGSLAGLKARTPTLLSERIFISG